MEFPSQENIQSSKDPNIDKELKQKNVKKIKKKKPPIGRRYKKVVKNIILYKKILAKKK